MKAIRYAILPAAAGLAFAAPAAAEEALPTLEVTARQWKEDPSTVPGSVAVVPAERLGGPGGDDFEAVAAATPNVAIEQSSAQTRVVMRGMSVANTGLQDPVGYFVDGVALPFGATQAPGFFGLRSMEILKGPQGTLYGRNTEAGAIKVETRDPSWTPAASLDLSAGFAKAAEGRAPLGAVEGWVSGAAIPDRLALGLTIRAEGAEGPFRNRRDGRDDGGDTERLGFSGAASLILDDDTDVSFKSTVARNDLGKMRMRYRTGAYATPRFETNYDTDSWDDSTSAVQSLQVNHRVGDAELTAITGWTHYDRDFQMDVDTASLPTLPALYSHTDDALSQELRLASADPSARLKWLGGMHVYREWTDIDYAIGTPRVTRRTEIDQTGVAGFGQMEYAVLERLRLGVGGRVEHVAQSGDQRYESAALDTAYDADQDVTTFLPRFTAAFDLTPETMFYASLARGYMPGGYNYAMASSAASFAYDPEYSWTTELGVKGRTADGRLGAGVAAFRTVTRDKQVVEIAVGGAQSFANAGEAEVYGLEFEADAEIAPKLRISGNFGLQHAESTDYRTATADYSGNRLPMAANYTWAAGVDYGKGEGAFAGARVRGSGPYYFDSANLVRQSAYATVDAELGYDFGGARVSLWGTNLFDEGYYTRGLVAPLGQIVEDAAGREIGLRVSAKW
ncbi:TonB-dependent receptor [uncultured Alphaproteobacteria bacterium]|uniref:TonB-dependent receptor n=1 Tax=uncultured Alphaproteobacteria bacterium TaxID=91750 RepID=A0A212JBL9_9PROT|nr:TonB-dependent receptor [uncultured Alphaproteobacteria bacterium]